MFRLFWPIAALWELAEAIQAEPSDDRIAAMHIRQSMNMGIAALVAVIAALAAANTAQAQDFYRGKTITLFAGMPPGGGIDSEMRLVANYFGKYIPGEPSIVPRNMQGAGGMILGNHLHAVAKPDGLTLGMPGRSGYLRLSSARPTSNTTCESSPGSAVPPAAISSSGCASSRTSKASTI
jgi:hypothetical protein